MRIQFALAVASLSVSFSAPATSAPAPAPLVQKAKKIIAQRMLDPGSVQIRSTHVVNTTIGGKPRQILCGEYNSKNKFGGYVGFETFLYEPTAVKGVLTFNMSGINIFAEGNGPDFYSDPTSAVRAGVPGDALMAQAKDAFALAEAYLPACMAS